MIRFWSICGNTFVQTIRQPIYSVLVLATFFGLVLCLPMAAWTMGEGDAEYNKSDQTFLIQTGMSTMLFSGLLLAAFCASSALSREIEDRTALTVISKPVPRPLFVLGKFGGVLGAVGAAFYLCTIVFLMTVRHKVLSSAGDPYDFPVIVLGTSALVLALLIAMSGNLFFGWPFTSAAVWSLLLTMTLAIGLIAFIGQGEDGWVIVPFGQGIPGDLLLGVAQIFMVITILVAVATAASTRLGQMMTLLVCLGLAVMGSAYQALFSNWGKDVLLLRALSPLFANLSLFYAVDALSTSKSVGGVYTLQAAVYCLLYTGAVLAIGVALFQRRGLEAEGGATGMPGTVSLMAGLGRIVAVVVGLAGLEGLASLTYKSLIDSHFTPVVFESLAGALGGTASTSTGIVVSLALLLAGPAGWIVWGRFGRGAKWAYVTVLTLTVLLIAQMGTALAVPTITWLRAGSTTSRLMINLIIAAVVLLIVLLPSTRRHFRQTAIR